MIWVTIGMFVMIVGGILAVQQFPYLGIPIIGVAMLLCLYGLTRIKDETCEEYFRKRPDIDD